MTYVLAFFLGLLAGFGLSALCRAGRRDDALDGFAQDRLNDDGGRLPSDPNFYTTHKD